MIKKYILFLMFPLLQLNAQIVSIPDPNLKNALLNNPTTIDTNGDGEIQVSEALAIDTLFLTSSNISDITGLEAFTNLVHLVLVGNNLTTVNVNGLVNLTGLNLDYNNLTSLTLGNVDNMNTLSLENNNLTSLDLSGKTISWVSVRNNQLTNLNVDNATINEIRADDNNLQSINLLNTPSLTKLYITNNQLTSLDTSGNPALFYLECKNNPLTTVDVSKNPNMFELLPFNPLLETLILKNGGNGPVSLGFGAGSTPSTAIQNLSYVCADEADIGYFVNYFDMFNIPDVYVSSYCTFAPGGNYNTITGHVKNDFAGNGCDDADSIIPFVKVHVTDAGTTGTVISNQTGLYNLYAQQGTYNVSAETENNYFTFTPESAAVSFPDNLMNVSMQNFCMVANGEFRDLDVVIIPGDPARPGFDATYTIIYKNKGTVELSGYVNLLYPDSVVDFVAANPQPSATSPNNLDWNFTNLQPFESRIIFVTMNVNSPMETPAVNIGDQLPYRAQVYPMENDETPMDNEFGLKQIVVGSMDPNDITCLEGETITPEQVGNYLHYLIRFQNMGTYYAENVVVVSEIDPADFDISTLQMIELSHPGEIRINGNKLEVFFEGINLPAEQDDEPGSHGHVVFKIRTQPTLTLGSSVAQTANIFFDFNHPITTNTAVTTVTALGIGEDSAAADISMYPNPVKANLQIGSTATIYKVAAYDSQGRLLMTIPASGNNVIINTESFSKGIYLIRIITADGSITKKIIKE